MNRPMIRIHDVSTDEVIDREMNDDEFAQWELDQKENSRIEAEVKAKYEARKTILAKLGLSEEEVATLLS